MKQKYTSADTSINSTKLPAIYRMIFGKIKETEAVLDYGCGKFFDNYNLPKNYFGYDPFNRADASVLNRTYDVSLCSNVLNVIMEKEIRLDVLRTLKGISNKSIITIYEGNKSGIGRVTKKDCYQLNKKRCDYFPEREEIFGKGNVRYHHGYFECVKEAAA